MVKAQDYIEGILAGDRVRLAQALTIIESSLESERELADAILSACLKQSGKSERIAISGSPGVGKSTFIEAYGMHLLQENHKVAVLAIDPSSQNSGGSILGDRTRMEKLSKQENAFIRPSPAIDALGGVAHTTRESILLCEAAGYNKILIETVGVGQSEVSASRMSDLFLVMVLAGAGDELQGIKRGIIELADILVVNKSDGNNRENAQKAKLEYSNALHLFPPKASEQAVTVHTVSSIESSGMEELSLAIEIYFKNVKSSGFFQKKRVNQKLLWLDDAIQLEVRRKFSHKGKSYTAISQRVMQDEIHPRNGAREILESL